LHLSPASIHRLSVLAWPTAFGTGRFGPMAAQPRAAHSHGAIGGGGVAPLLKSRNRHLAGEEKSFGLVRHHWWSNPCFCPHWPVACQDPSFKQTMARASWGMDGPKKPVYASKLGNIT
jgi:hypothetical protein